MSRDRRPYFAARRATLKRRRVCVRCGDERAARGHKCCAACVAVAIAKKASDEIEKRRLLAKLGRIRRNLDLARCGVIALESEETRLASLLSA